MNPTTALFLLLTSSFIFPAAAISYAHAASATVIINQPNAKTFKCIDPTGKKLLCILVVTNVKPPKNTLNCKDPDNHRFKCTYIIINKKDINTKVFHKIVFLYVYVTPKYKKLLFENKSKVVPIFVTKTVVKIIHEHEYSGKVRIVVIKEEEDYDRPTAVAINCFAPCFQQEYTRAIIQKTIINAPVFITNVNQITSIVNNVNTINSVNVINNNLINNAYVNNVNTDNMNIFHPPPPPAYSPTNLFSVPPDTPIYKGGTANPNAPANMIGFSPSGPTNEFTPTQTQTNQTLLNSPPQAITPGCGQGTDNSTCQSNSNPTPTPQQNTATTPQPSNTPPFNNSNTSSPVNNTITPPSPPSASNTTPNNITSSGPTENNTTSNPSTPSNSQAITPGCGQGTDNSTCQSNQTPKQNATTTTPPVDCNANPNDPSCPQQNVNNNSNQPQEQQLQQHTQTCPDGSVIDISATCPSTTNNNQSADNGNGNSNYGSSNSTDDSSGSSGDNHHH
ncbi:MAG: hypothetical protein WCC17_19565 [Candidatus Nitrosopolaris sp.]